MIDLKNVTIRELAKILELEKYATVHFTAVNELDMKMLSSYRFMGNAERDAHVDGTYSEDIEYSTNDVGIHLPDITVEQCMSLENRRNPMAVNAMQDAIASKIKKIYIKEEKLIVVTFMMLHEIGHAIHFEQSGLSPFEYSQQEGQDRQQLNRESKSLSGESNYIMQRMLLEENEKKYRNLPSEKFADEYATNHIVETIKKIRETLGYTEEDLKRV